MANPPDQGAVAIPEGFKWPAPTPLDARKYLPEVTRGPDIPAPRATKDHTGDVGRVTSDDDGTWQDVLSDLDPDEIARLLKANDINLDAGGRATMRGYSLGKTLTAANGFGIRVARLSCHTADGDLTTGASVTYDEVTSSIERQSAAASNAGGGVPGIFRFDASFTNSAATAERSQSVRVYFQASQRIPKARVQIEREDISLDPKFVDRIRAAVAAGTAEELLDHLRDYGQFVPTALILGGRMTLHTSTQLDDASRFAATEAKLAAAADARFEVEGTPGEAGLGAAHGRWDKFEATTVTQAKELAMELRGGNEALAKWEPGTLGGRWSSSVGPFIRWRVIGFAPNSLVPTTDFLDPALKAACLDLLRGYFSSKLVLARTEVAGSAVDDIYGPDDATLGRVKRITEIVIDNGDNIDGLKWKFELYPAPGAPAEGSAGYDGSAGIGRWRGEKDKLATLRLAADERVVSIEACCERGEGLRRLAIRTNKRRCPTEGYYGRTRSATEVHLIQAPRVVGFHGYKATLVHAIGLSYLQLGGDTHSPDFLEKIEPLLFPKRDFGPI